MTQPAKHTPGPWSTERDRAKSISIYGGSTFIGEVYNEVDETSLEEQANTNLIAAAPAMYEALSELVKYLREEVADEALDTWAPVFKAAMALAQAEGRQG